MDVHEAAQEIVKAWIPGQPGGPDKVSQNLKKIYLAVIEAYIEGNKQLSSDSANQNQI